jgi:hypothetical protein
MGKLASLPSLTKLNLRCNFLTGALSEDIGLCSKLTTLVIEGACCRVVL